MLSIGDTLRDARIAKGISLEQAEEDTKIRKRYLQALEEGDYSILPGMVYAKGFLKNYASYLGLNQEELMIEYKLLHAPVRETEPRPNIEEVIQKRRANNRVNRRTYFITVVVAVLAILIFALYSMVVKMNSETPKSGDNENNVKTGQMAKTNKESTPNKPENTLQGQSIPQGQQAVPQGQPQNPPVSISEGQGEGTLNLVLKGREASWIKVYVDGRVEYTGILKPGETKTFTAADKIKFRSGNAGGTEVTLNGQNLGTLGPAGKVINKEFTSQAVGAVEQNR